MTETAVCRQCGAPAHVTRLGHLEGEDHGVRVALDGLGVLECEHGHKRLVSADFPVRFIDGLLAAPDIPPVAPAEKKGLFRKHLHCTRCGEELPHEARGDEAAQRTVDLADAEPVAVEVRMPVYRCPKCGERATVPSDEAKKEVVGAVEAAFKSAGIAPG